MVNMGEDKRARSWELRHGAGRAGIFSRAAGAVPGLELCWRFGVWFEVEVVRDVPLQILKGQTKDENEKGAQRVKEERKTFYLSYCFSFMFKDLTTIR